MSTEIVELSVEDIDEVNGGFVCAGLCVLGGIVAGIALFNAGVSVGRALGEAF